MVLRLNPAQARTLGLEDTTPRRPRRKPGEPQVLADGHVVDPDFVDWSEKALQQQVMAWAKSYGWTCGAKDEAELAGLVFHAYSAMNQAERGWPDLTLIRRRDRRLIFAELKKERGCPTPRQAAVLDLLRSLANASPLWPGAGRANRTATGGIVIQVCVWRPCQLEEIERVLR